MKNRRKIQRITVKDYLKAVKKADREIQLEQQAGWVAVHKAHKNSKLYNRKVDKKHFLKDWKNGSSVK